MAPRVLFSQPRFQARALLLGERIHTRPLSLQDRLALTPLVLPCGEAGAAVLMRFGAVVVFGATAAEQDALLARVEPQVGMPYERPLEESLDVRVQSGAQESFSGNRVTIAEPSIERLQLIADILAKSLVLELYEKKLSAVFDRIEPMARRLHSRWSRRWRLDQLTDQIGLSLLTEQRMVGRVEMKEKPELLWDHPELEGLYLRLFDEYELGERSAALEHKLDLVTRTAETLLRLEESRRSLRAEWYIILLIVVEILLTLYELFVRH